VTTVDFETGIVWIKWIAKREPSAASKTKLSKSNSVGHKKTQILSTHTARFHQVLQWPRFCAEFLYFPHIPD
jgi:hypothetical protein